MMKASRIEIIDVRDLANFTIDCVEQKTAGIYNTCTPRDSYTFGQLLEDSVAVTSADIEPVWVDEAFGFGAVEVDYVQVGQAGAGQNAGLRQLELPMPVRP